MDSWRRIGSGKALAPTGSGVSRSSCKEEASSSSVTLPGSEESDAKDFMGTTIRHRGVTGLRIFSAGVTGLSISITDLGSTFSPLRRSPPTTLPGGEVKVGEDPPGVELGVGAGVAADEFGAVVLGAEVVLIPAEPGGAIDKAPLRGRNARRKSAMCQNQEMHSHVHIETRSNLR